MIVPMAGATMLEIGHEVDGEEAVRLCAAGFAVPVVEGEAVTATPEKATRKRVAKETRKAD